MGKNREGTSETEGKTPENAASGQNEDNNTPAGETPGGSNTSGEFHPDTFNPQLAAQLVEGLRKTEKQLRKELNQARSQVQDYEQQNQSELETATQKVGELEATNQLLQQQLRQMRVRVTASSLGITDPLQQKAASELLDWEKLGQEPEEKAIEAELNKLITDAPWLKTNESQPRQQPKVTATNPQRESQAGPGSLAEWLGGAIGAAKSGDSS